MSNSQISVYALEDEMPKYIGITNFPERRLKEHIRRSRYKNDEKSNWIKNGAEKKLHIIDVVPESEWKFWEKHYISLYKSWGFVLFNKNNGGYGCITHTMPESAKIKIREFQKGKQWSLGRKLSEEHKNKLREANKGRDNTYALSCAHKARIGSKHSEETKKHWSEIRKGKKATEETKRKLSLLRRGKKLSSKHAANIGRGHWKPIIQLDKDGAYLKEWSNMSEVQTKLKILISSLSNCLSGVSKTAGGFKWRYKYVTN